MIIQRARQKRMAVTSDEKVLVNFCDIRISWGLDSDSPAEEERVSRGCVKQERALNHRTPGDGKCRDHNTENEAKMEWGLKPGMLSTSMKQTVLTVPHAQHICETVQFPPEFSLSPMLSAYPYRANKILKNQYYIKQT